MMTPWDPAREEFAAIWRVIQTLTQDVAALKQAVYDNNRQDRDD